MCRRGARLRREHERGTELHRDGAGAQDGRDRGPVGDAARRDQVDRVSARDEPEQREQPDVLAVGLVEEASPVPTALGALHHEDVGPGRDGLPGLLEVGDRHPDVDARRLQACHVRTGRTAERERHDCDALGDRELELVVPAVVVEARLAEGDAEPLRLVPQRLGVGGERLGVDPRRRRREDVEPEWRAGSRAHRPDLVAHGVVAPISGREEAETAGLADRDGERRGRRAAGHRGLDDRLVEGSQIDRCSLGALVAEVARGPGGCRALDRLQLRPLHRADLLGARAARMEGAARRQSRGARRLAAQSRPRLAR